MKKLFLLSLALLSMPIFAECDFKQIESTGTIYVVPIYKGQVLYYFEDAEKKAMAHVQWNYDADATGACYRKAESEFTGKIVTIPAMNGPEFEIEVFKGLKKERMQMFLEPGSQYHGNTELIPVDYRSKSEILRSIKDKKELVTFSSGLSFNYEKKERKTVGEINCSWKGELFGVTALHKRLGEVMKLIQARAANEKINRDEILERFMGSCVELHDLEVTTMEGLALARRVKLTKGKIPLEGETIVKGTEKIPAYSVFESSYIEY